MSIQGTVRNSVLAALAAALMAAGCSSTAPTPVPTPTPTPTPTSTPVSDRLSVRFEGRVVDDSEGKEPVAGATVLVNTIGADHRYYTPLPSDVPPATSDSDGFFVLNAMLPSTFNDVAFGVQRMGFDSPVAIYFTRAEAESAVALQIYRTITIRPGESAEARVFLGSYVCGFESARCRRIVVAAAPGDRVELELTQSDGSPPVGLTDTDSAFTYSGYQRALTVTGTEAWLIGGPTTVTLTARKR